MQVHESIIPLPLLLWKSAAVPFMWRKWLRGFSWSLSTESVCVCVCISALHAGYAYQGGCCENITHMLERGARLCVCVCARAQQGCPRKRLGDKVASRFLPSSHLSISIRAPIYLSVTAAAWTRLCGPLGSPSGYNSTLSRNNAVQRWNWNARGPRTEGEEYKPPQQLKAEPHLWHQLFQSIMDRLSRATQFMAGAPRKKASVGRVSLLRWLSRSNFKFQIRALFKLLNRALCQLSWSYCSTQASNTQKHNYSSSWHMTTIPDTELERPIIGSCSKKKKKGGWFVTAHRLEHRCDFFCWLVNK